ncbi:hypothetical protein FACS189413_13130 [Bacteroidia bacterium]|nr:hypothetical protein FACS189413_13130 [Bacteroidia bacterium]
MLFVSSYADVSTSFAGGEGTKENPYKIETAVQLDSVRWHMTEHFVLMNDINLETSGYPVFRGLGKRDTSEPSNSFTSFNGSFDGQGHVISGVNMIGAGNYYGLFAVIGGEVRNLGVEGTLQLNGASAGLLAGYLGQDGFPSIIENCYAKGTVVIAGDHATTGQAAVLLGVQTKAHSILRNCYSEGEVSNTAYTYSGGIVGRVMNAGGTLENCYSTANIKGGDHVGGITGSVNGNNVNYTYATGRVEGNANVGGVIGTVAINSATSGHIAANASISAATDPVGRVAGNIAGTVADVYGLKNMEIKKNGVSISVSSNLYDKDGLTTDLAVLQDVELYEDEIGWDFEGVWTMPETAGFPIFQWQTSGETAIASASTNDTKAFFQGNLLHIQELSAPTDVSVYSVAGQLIKSIKSLTGSTVIIVPHTGVYIVKLASNEQTKAIKVINQ